MESKITKEEKFEIIYDLKNKHTSIEVKYMCGVAGVSRSGYYSFISRKDNKVCTESKDDQDFKMINKAYEFKGRNKGARQIQMVLLNKYKIIMNLKKIRRLMKKYGLYCPIRRANPYRKMAKAMATHSYYENIVDRKFDRDISGLILLTDITYLKYNGKTAYLSTIKDACTREIVAYQLSRNLELPFVIETVNGLLRNENIILQPEVIIHSDQGCHYTSKAYQNSLDKNHIKQSMSRRGNCWDNAPQESFFGHMKDELNLNLNKCQSFTKLQKEIDDYMDYYNNHRY